MNDYQIIVSGIAAMLGEFPRLISIKELTTGLPVLSDVDLILYDTFGRTSLDDIALRHLIRGNPSKVIVYTWDIRSDTLARVEALGAAGCLSKEMEVDQLLGALEDIRAGRTVINPSTATHDSTTAPGVWPGQVAMLTPREAEILSLITQGLTNQEIAVQLFLSINSIKSYIRGAYRKIDVDRRAQAIIWGVENGLRPQLTRTIVS